MQSMVCMMSEYCHADFGRVRSVRNRTAKFVKVSRRLWILRSRITYQVQPGASYGAIVPDSLHSFWCWKGRMKIRLLGLPARWAWLRRGTHWRMAVGRRVLSRQEEKTCMRRHYWTILFWGSSPSHLSQTSETETGSSHRLSDMGAPHRLEYAGRLSQIPTVTQPLLDETALTVNEDIAEDFNRQVMIQLSEEVHIRVSIRQCP